jgi:hypothetical protein
MDERSLSGWSSRSNSALATSGRSDALPPPRLTPSAVEGPAYLPLVDVVISPLLWLLDRARGWHQRRRRVRVLVHEAVFLEAGPPRTPHLFVKVTNLSATRDIEVTHVWFDVEPRADILDERLPARLRPDETWETWIPVARLHGASKAETRGRVMISTGKVIKSRLNRKVPPVGMVAAGQRAR